MGGFILRRIGQTLVVLAIALMLTVVGLNLFGDGLRDTFDPKLRQ